jgi:hypothetical protein
MLKCYFDGGNDARSGQQDRITLATVCATGEQCSALEASWNEVLNAHEAEFLHTTNAATLNKEFAKAEGWDEESVDRFISDCVGVIEHHHATVEKPGINVITLTIPLDDYRRAREAANLPNSVYEICATESLSFCFKWGKHIGAESYELYFDQGESFYGHVCDRQNKRQPRKDIPFMGKVTGLDELNMRKVPALQIADLFAWCINHNDAAFRNWHKRLNDLQAWWSPILDYDHLVKPTRSALERIAAWKLPTRGLIPARFL